jgi:hypothetical protein
LLEVLIQQFYVDAPIEVDEPIAKGDHSHHRLAKLRVEVASLNQERKDVAAFLGMTKLVDRDNVRRDIRAALNSRLKSTLYCQTTRKITLERL